MKGKKIIASALMLATFSIVTADAQSDRWQQKVNYNINVDVNVKTNQFTGTENITYWNNSPDTLKKLFIHTYWNAFQPNSMMDVRSRELGKTVLGTTKSGQEVRDWDGRVKDRISHLKPDEIGYQRVKFVKINGVSQKLIEHETILEVDLSKPILPKSSSKIDIDFNAQVPLQVRRSGRDNEEGVRYSMSQWYPKIVEYDYQGWNANPYIAREFYGVWGAYNVTINLDPTYLVAGTGTIQNPNEVGFGYGTGTGVVKNGVKTWKFAADNVHDFVWAADPDYKLIKRQPKNGPLLYIVFKQKDANTEKLWNIMADTVAYAYPYIAKTFGPYPYKNYSFIQGGDGGMEYPMATLIKGNGIGTALHEWMHSWYQGMMGSNESLYPFMDEGGATYAESRITGWLHHDSMWYLPPYLSYYRLVKSGLEEPMTTHSDHYNTNFAYGQAAYSKGGVWYEQLSYIIGNENMDKFLLEYYKQWHFKHPNPNDFIRVAEEVSGLELQWYNQYWIGTTKTIDYGIGDIKQENDSSLVTIKRIGKMPMPLDILVTYKDGSKEWHYIPLELTYGAKPAEADHADRIIEKEWPWTNPETTIKLSKQVGSISSIEIDPSQRMADVDRTNNKLVVPNN